MTLKPEVPAGNWTVSCSPTFLTPRWMSDPTAGSTGAYLLGTTGFWHPVGGVEGPTVGPGMRVGAAQLTAVAGATAGGLQTFP